MTINELAEQLMELSGGNINHKKYDAGSLKKCITEKFEGTEGGNIAMQIGLPDGWWHFTINRWVERGHYQYFYTIPETREAEAAMLPGGNRKVTGSRKKIMDLVKQLDPAVYYYTETPLPEIAQAYHGFKYFLIYRNTHCVCHAARTQQEIIDFLEEVISSDYHGE